jgi:5'-3' exoribonuclease 2
MKYNEAMATKDKPEWLKAVKEEFDRMQDHQVFQLVKRAEVPPGAKVLTSTWAMKKKSNGKFRARLNGRGYEQIDGKHYDKDSIASPTINIVTVRIIMVLMLLMRGYAHLVDVNGAFLLGNWENDPITEEERQVYMEVPQGFESFFPKGDWILLLLKTIYGTKQAAKRFWLLLLGLFVKLGFKYNRADPCLYYHWGKDGLVMWASWVDDCLGIGPESEVLRTKGMITSHLKCDDLGPMKEYVGYKVDIDWAILSAKFTQPVLLQSFVDEFQAKPVGHSTPAIPGSTLQATTSNSSLNANDLSKYHSGVGKLLHLMRWSRPDILNATREVSQFMSNANHAHSQAMHRILEYCVGTPERSLLLAPKGVWDGKDKKYPFVISGKCDAEHAKCQETRKSVGDMWCI